MKLVDYGPSLVSTASRAFWDKLPGVSRTTYASNRLFLALGATPLRTVRMASGSRLRVDLRSIGQWDMFYTREADQFWVDVCTGLLDEDRLFLDIGANIGIYVVQVAAAKRIAGQCHAFEPMPANIARCRENIALNGLDDLVTLNTFGLSDEVRTLKLAFVAVEGEDTGNAEIVLEDAPGDTRPRFEIEVRRLDDVALPDRPIGVIKIDVEQHEEFAYRGGARRLAADRPFIVGEYNRVELEKKGLGPQMVFDAELPADYVALRRDGARLVPVTDWLALHRLDNFLACPAEKVDRALALRLGR